MTLTLDGAEDPAAIDSHRTALLNASVFDAEDDVSSVEFFYGEASLGTVLQPPFEIEIPLSSVDTGLRTFRAVAVDLGGMLGQDELEVSINIAGGNVEDLKRSLFEAALIPEGQNAVGGGISTFEGRVYVSAINADGSGRLVSLLPELEEQWTQTFANGLRAPGRGTPEGDLALGTAEGGNWVVRLLDSASGDTIESWILGTAPAEYGGFGPQLAVSSEAVYATTGTRTVSRYSLDGEDLGQLVDTEHGVISGIVTNTSSDRAYLSYGDAFDVEDASCATSSDFCALAVSADGEVEWITGLAKQFAGVHKIAAARDGGVFLAASVPDDQDNAYLLLKLSSSGVVGTMRLHGSTGATIGEADDDAVIALEGDSKGDVVVCGSYGPVVADAGDESSTFVALFDESLNLVWELRDIFEPNNGAFTLGCAASDDSVFVYGLEDLNIGQVGNAPAGIGQAWVARISL